MACKYMFFEALTRVYASVILDYGICNSFQTQLCQGNSFLSLFQSLDWGHRFGTTFKKSVSCGFLLAGLDCSQYTGMPHKNTSPRRVPSFHWKLHGEEGEEKTVSGQSQSQTGSVRLERAKVLPGSLRHDSLVFSLPTDDRLPFFWHLRQKKSSKINTIKCP